MAKKYKVQTNAVFNKQPVGSTIELDEGVAKAYEKLGYLEIIEEVKPKRAPARKKKAAPKKGTTKKKDTK